VRGKRLAQALFIVPMIGLQILFAAGIWFMISTGMAPALGSIMAQVLALIVAPLVAVGAMVLFIWGEQIRRRVLEYEAVHNVFVSTNKQGEEEETQGHSKTWIITAGKVAIFLADSAGITYRVLLLDVTTTGKVLLIIVFEILAISPWGLGTIFHMLTHRPAEAIARDADIIEDITDAEERMAIANERRRKLYESDKPKLRLLQAPRKKEVFPEAVPNEKQASR